MHKYLDGAAVLLLFLAGLGVGAMHVRNTRHAGASPEVTGFHRRVYAAAVMSACGRGLTTPSSAIADGTEPRAADRALVDFVMQQRENLAKEVEQAEAKAPEKPRPEVRAYWDTLGSAEDGRVVW